MISRKEKKTKEKEKKGKEQFQRQQTFKKLKEITTKSI